MHVSMYDRKTSNTAAGLEKLKTAIRRRGGDETKCLPLTLVCKSGTPPHMTRILHKGGRGDIVNNGAREKMSLRRYKTPNFEEVALAAENSKFLVIISKLRTEQSCLI